MNKILLILLSLLILSCTSTSEKVSRVDAEYEIDLSGRWNDTDSRSVSTELTADMLSRPWLTFFQDENDRRPVVIVGSIRNMSSEHINVLTFVKDIERELINSGTIKVVASSDERSEIREEKEDQQSFATLESAKKLAQETGADLMLIGSIITISDRDDDLKVIYYQVDLELVNLQSNEKVWIGSKKHKKIIEIGGNEW